MLKPRKCKTCSRDVEQAKIYAINWRCNDTDERKDYEMIADFAQKMVDEAAAAYKIALADAIRSPMGVSPDSAQGLLSDGDLEQAELRRTGNPVVITF